MDRPIPRNIEDKIKDYLKLFPCVALIGARQTGKTTIAKMLQPDWDYVDLERPKDFDTIERDPEFFFQQHPNHLIIDEAQAFPLIFNILRGVIDENRSKKGRFIITGSSSPELLSAISESLAGRIGIIEVGTLTANEYTKSSISPIFTAINKPSKKLLEICKNAPKRSAKEIETHWMYGGYPEAILSKSKKNFQAWMDNYQKTYISRDISTLFPRLNQINYRRFISMLASLSGRIINKSNISESLGCSDKTTSQYIEIAHGTFIWRNLPSYDKSRIKSVSKMPKGYVRDSGLLHNLLNIQSYKDLFNHPSFGQSFESYVIETMIKGIQATTHTNLQTYYYRTKKGVEIDLILEGSFGTIPVEIKSGVMTKESSLNHLRQFMNEHNLEKGIVVNQAESPTLLAENIIQIPIHYL